MKNNNSPAAPLNEKPFSRREKRYNHIYIVLQVKIGYEWKQIKALDWNKNGFNFFLEHDIPYSNAFFKKGIAKFHGKIMWKRMNDEAVAMETILNTLLFEQLEKIDDKNTASRVERLIRANDRIEEKKKLLSLLKPQTLDNDITKMKERDWEEHRLYRYGVFIDKKDWADIVEQTLQHSAAILSLEKLTKEISGIADSMDQIKKD